MAAVTICSDFGIGSCGELSLSSQIWKKCGPHEWQWEAQETEEMKTEAGGSSPRGGSTCFGVTVSRPKPPDFTSHLLINSMHHCQVLFSDFYISKTPASHHTLQNNPHTFNLDIWILHHRIQLNIPVLSLFLLWEPLGTCFSIHCLPLHPSSFMSVPRISFLLHQEANYHSRQSNWFLSKLPT